MRDSRCRLALTALLAIASPSLGSDPAAKPSPLPPGIVKISVDDLHCATCARRAARKLYAVKGVLKVSSSLKKDVIVIKLPVKQPIPVARLWSAVAAADVQPVSLRHGAEEFDDRKIKKMLAQAGHAIAPR